MTLQETIAAALEEHQPYVSSCGLEDECRCGEGFRVIGPGEFDMNLEAAQAAHQAAVVMHIALNWPAV